MKWFCYRNEKTGMEIKRNAKGQGYFVPEGYKLMRVIDLEVTPKEKRANKGVNI